MVTFKEFQTEAFVTHAQRMHRRASAERSAHKRSAKGFERPHRFSDGGITRKMNRHARETLLHRMFPGVSKKFRSMNPYEKSAIRAFLDTDRKSIRKISKKLKGRKLGKRSDFGRLSKANYNNYAVDTRGGYGSLTNSFDYKEIANMIVENDSKKLEKLFLRGLVDKDKVEDYKRILANLSNAIKYRRYQDDISDLLQTLISIITKDSSIYNRVRLELQKR